ncbi:MAG: redox-regulated ATPase YchF [Anaerolineaceae bacterium]|nr:redox-regulated ATPase YchF [Anaerolineaceae bacterium]
MQLGIIGLPQSGKTTIFNTLTRGDQPTGVSVGRMEVHTAVIDVPDERVDRLSEMFHPKKTIYAKVTYADIAGLGGAADKGEISGQLLNQLTQMDGFIEVVRCFESPMVPHVHGSVNPARDIQLMDEEFLLNDQIMVERKLDRLAEEHKKGGGRDKGIVEREIALFKKLQETLSTSTPLRDIIITKEEEKTLLGFGFLSRKPLLILLNLGEGQAQPEIQYDHLRSQIVSLQGKLEMDLGQLSDEDAALFMHEYGIEELGLSRMIQASYDLLGLLSFFTVGEDEVRAWTVRRGAFAPEAAGEIHTDLQKGFIRAEVITFNDLMEVGSMAEGRSKGKLRLEGKQYPVQDGDIISIRFSV